MMPRRILIANRGEIAARVIRACRRLGIDHVLAVSAADHDSVPARLADSVHLLGPAPAAQSYLDVDAVIAAARTVQADAIHPGYGFLAENPALARACADAGITFIGPSARVLEQVGDKVRARELAIAAGIPVVPGASVANRDEAIAAATTIGYPILIKAVGGGGGRGMKRCDTAADLAAQLPLAIAEAQAAFADPRVYLERCIEHGRHVEVQILGDGARVVQLGDRDCSVQRRYQKLIEEAPAPRLSPSLRAQLHQAAVAYGEALDYLGAGTVEFLVDVDREAFHFLEMNARIQVEHPVTEAITGIDLVAAQIALAGGYSLWLDQADIHLAGHAIECRINAEDPELGFRPSPGTVRRAVFPAGDGIRVDSHIEAGSEVPPFYDSLLAKIIAVADTRESARSKLTRALARCQIDGVATNLSLQHAVLQTPEFIGGGVTTTFLERWLRQRPQDRQAS